LFALETNIARLADDHRRCRFLAERIAKAPGLAVDLASVETNMVFADTRPSGLRAAEVVGRLASRGVLCLDEGPYAVRFVTHLDVDDQAVEEAARIILEVMSRRA
jgi:threonine aldolase